MQHLDDGLLAAILDGQADGQEHAATCPECRARLDAMRAVRERAQAILRSGAPGGTRASFQDVLRRRHQAGTDARRLANLRPLAWAATVVLALGLGWYARELSLRPRPAAGLVGEAAQRPTPAAEPAGQAAPRPASPRPARTPPVLRDQPAMPSPAGAAVPAPVPAAAAAPAVTVADRNELKKKEADVATVTTAAKAAAPAGAGARPPAALDESRAAGVPAPAAVPAQAWETTSLAHATQVLGRAPLRLEGYEVASYAVRGNEAGGGPAAVRVVQRLPAGGEVALVQEEAPGTDALSAVSGALRDRRDAGIAVVVRGVRVTASGTVSADSLRVLVGKLR